MSHSSRSSPLLRRRADRHDLLVVAAKEDVSIVLIR
jgi:hypothetical protein